MLERHLEELTLNAWPAADSLLYDGWVLCFSGGYTRRANSVHPIYPSSVPLAVCEAPYAARSRETVFKITVATDPPTLDATLAGLGYTAISATIVQTSELTGLASALDESVAVATSLNDQWLDEFNRLSATPEPLRASERRLLEKIVPPHAFASIVVGEACVAQGMAIAERGYVGLFDIVVEHGYRNRGLARRLCTRLLQWGHQEGADRAYLAVMDDNAPALHLYAKLGFREAYRYWYRYKPRSS